MIDVACSTEDEVFHESAGRHSQSCARILVYWRRHREIEPTGEISLPPTGFEDRADRQRPMYIP